MSSARPKSNKQEVKEAEHDPKLDEGKTYGARAQSGIRPLMRKRKADESDVVEEAESSESGEEGEVKNKAEGMEGGIPKVTQYSIIPNYGFGDTMAKHKPNKILVDPTYTPFHSRKKETKEAKPGRERNRRCSSAQKYTPYHLLTYE